MVVVNRTYQEIRVKGRLTTPKLDTVDAPSWYRGEEAGKQISRLRLSIAVNPPQGDRVFYNITLWGKDALMWASRFEVGLEIEAVGCPQFTPYLNNEGKPECRVNIVATTDRPIALYTAKLAYLDEELPKSKDDEQVVNHDSDVGDDQYDEIATEIATDKTIPKFKSKK